jgi:hypothetical protein
MGKEDEDYEKPWSDSSSLIHIMNVSMTMSHRLDSADGAETDRNPSV